MTVNEFRKWVKEELECTKKMKDDMRTGGECYQEFCQRVDKSEDAEEDKEQEKREYRLRMTEYYCGQIAILENIYGFINEGIEIGVPSKLLEKIFKEIS